MKQIERGRDRPLKVAISGAGVAGLTLAYWLLRAGHRPTVIEAAPRLRDGGYMIDFWGVGYAVAERMGLVPSLRQAGYEVQEVRYIDGRGAVSRISAKTMLREMGDRFTSLPRGDLARLIHDQVKGRCDLRFGVTIADILQHAAGVRVTLSDRSVGNFDLVIGAGGVHCGVRELVFGPEAALGRRLGYQVAAFETAGYRPRDELAYVTFSLPARQVSRFALRGDRTMFLLVFTDDQLRGRLPSTTDERKGALMSVFSDVGWEWSAIAQALEAAEDVYFDSVSQIYTPRWSKGRVALVGDAAACVSLLAGEGAGLAMTEAYVLAGEIAADADPARAFARYEGKLRTFVERKQNAARGFAGAFTPRTALGLFFRNQAIRAMAIPGVAQLLVGAQMRDDFQLPSYGF